MLRKLSTAITLLGLFVFGWMGHRAWVGWDTHEAAEASLQRALDRGTRLVQGLSDLLSDMPGIPEVSEGEEPTRFDELQMEQRILTKEIVGERERLLFQELEAQQRLLEERRKREHDLELAASERNEKLLVAAIPALITGFFGWLAVRKKGREVTRRSERRE